MKKNEKQVYNYLKYPIMFSNNYYSEWDTIIQNWYSDKTVLKSLMDKGNSLSIDHIPEPYYGDMDKCSIVIINLNPGTGLCEQLWDNQDIPLMMVNLIKKINYSCFAKSFPMLSLQGQSPKASVNWWEIRKRWIDRILKGKGTVTDKKPFAIELVPLHSKSFRVANTDAYIRMMENNHPDLNIIEAIEYAIRESDAKMGLAVGKPIFDVLCNNGFRPIQGYGISWPHQPIPSTKRYYCVIEKEKNPFIRILCTWSHGSNSAPAKKFGPHEEALLQNCFPG